MDKSLVADHVVCTTVSWEDLNKAGFIFGRPVRISGAAYLCRSLKVGNQKGVSNEWDAILNQTTEDNDLWHWKRKYFWGQEPPKNWASYRAVRGYRSARYWDYRDATYRYAIVGFRPVLESLPSEPLISDSLLGSPIKVYGPG